MLPPALADSWRHGSTPRAAPGCRLRLVLGGQRARSGLSGRVGGRLLRRLRLAPGIGCGRSRLRAGRVRAAHLAERLPRLPARCRPDCVAPRPAPGNARGAPDHRTSDAEPRGPATRPVRRASRGACSPPSPPPVTSARAVSLPCSCSLGCWVWAKPMAASGRVSARRTGRGAHPRRRPTLGAAVAARQRVRGVRTARPPERVARPGPARAGPSRPADCLKQRLRHASSVDAYIGS